MHYSLLCLCKIYELPCVTRIFLACWNEFRCVPFPEVILTCRWESHLFTFGFQALTMSWQVGISIHIALNLNGLKLKYWYWEEGDCNQDKGHGDGGHCHEWKRCTKGSLQPLYPIFNGYLQRPISLYSRWNEIHGIQDQRGPVHWDHQ